VLQPRQDLPRDVDAEVQGLVQRVQEFDDRTSPADQPDMLLITAGELRGLLEEAVNIGVGAAIIYGATKVPG
jgi:hypothetical protein